METKRLKELANKVLNKTAIKEETHKETEKQSFLRVSLKGNSKPIDIYEENDKSFQFLGYGGNQGNRETGPLPLPYFDLNGDLVVPFGCDSHYHWWNGGRSIKNTEDEVRQWKH